MRRHHCTVRAHVICPPLHASASLDRLLRTNLRGTLVINRLAAKSIRPGGAIVNISSAITKTLAPGYTVYGATKAGVETITTILARELKGRDITVNAVAPGPTETEMFLADLTNSDNGKAMRQGLVDAVPLERIGTPDDIAEVVLALAGPVRWVNGQTIHLYFGREDHPALHLAPIDVGPDGDA